MPETRDAALVRNAISIMWSLDRHELEPISNADWARVFGNPWQAFMKFDDATRERVWTAIQRRLPENLREKENAHG